MAYVISQADRWLVLDTKLGQDALLATAVKGSEGMSELFEFRVDAVSSKTVISSGDLLGTSATLSMARPGGQRRLVNGIVTSLSAGAVTRNDYRLYALTVSPLLWTLGQTSDYKVYQDKSVVDVVSDLLDQAGISYEKSLNESYQARDYCTQFGETDLAFLQRLLAEEGIFFYFKHGESAHKLVLCDASSAYVDAGQQTLYYRQDQTDVADAVHAFELGSNLTETTWTLRDYNYENAANPVEHTTKTALKPASSKGWEQFRYPGDGMRKSRLTRLAGAAVDATDAGFEIASGSSSAASLTPGHRFTLAEHPASDVADKQFVATHVAHEARDRAYFAARPGAEGEPFYRNNFSCIPAKRPARAPLPMPKPVVHGPQTALVVGRKADVDSDEYGRIKIRFFWDRAGEKNDQATCQVRVAQPLAGSNWGAVFIPRGGMEVVVHFLDGDPDRPLVTGAVYNSANVPPWLSESSGTKSGLLTRSMSSANKAQANELSFDDKAGSEKLTLHAQKDFVREVENDDTLDVGNNQTETVKNDRKTTLSEGSDTLTIAQGDRQVTVSKGNQTTRVSNGSVTVEAMRGITLKCGDSTVELTPQGIKINGMQVALTGTSKIENKAPMVTISADGAATIKGGMVKIN